MLNKKLKNFSQFLRKEKVSVIGGVTLGLLITISSTPSDTNVDSKPVTEVECYEVSSETFKPVLGSLVPNTTLTSMLGLEETSVSNNTVDSTTTQETTEIKEETTTVVEETSTITQEVTITDIFEITAYCSCKKCCGKWSPEVTGSTPITASGTIPVQGKTIAVDPNVIPLGTYVTINGKEYFAEDVGGAIKGKRIDMYFDSHQVALDWGRKKIEVTYTIVK